MFPGQHVLKWISYFRKEKRNVLNPYFAFLKSRKKVYNSYFEAFGLQRRS